MPPKRKAQSDLRTFGAVNKSIGASGKRRRADVAEEYVPCPRTPSGSPPPPAPKAKVEHFDLTTPAGRWQKRMTITAPFCYADGDEDKVMWPLTAEERANTLESVLEESNRKRQEEVEAERAAAVAFLEAHKPRTRAGTAVAAVKDKFSFAGPSAACQILGAHRAAVAKGTAGPKTPAKSPRKKAVPKSRKKTPAKTPSKQQTLLFSPPPTSDAEKTPAPEEAVDEVKEEVTKEAKEDSTKDDKPAEGVLPEYLRILGSKYIALLKTLLLCRSQNQSGVLPSFTTVKPQVESLSRHAFSLSDLRQIVWMSHQHRPAGSKPAGLKLVDYGNGKLCIAFTEDAATKLLHTDQLTRAFTTNLRTYHASHPAASTPIPESDIADHIHKATIHRVLHGKAASLLADLKAGAKSKPSLSLSLSVTKTAGAPAARGSSLLDRIRAKAAAAVAPPTAAELAHASARDRVPEVTEILRGFRTGAQSVALQACVLTVQESVRSPLSAEEAAMAVRMVAEREAWCEVRESFGVAAVVFKKVEGVERFA
ncbi:hypothetical protein EDC01DRAFT_74630 [Geopyxis carbonaria]|nr:hypothetical protein EDC01DRAFT_74630 [Geopyxis carbonaria]